MQTLRIGRRHLEDMLRHAEEGAPEEVCGILAGRGQEVTEVYRMTNTEHSPVSYFMDPKEQFRVMKDMRQKGLKMLGIYHSHPVAGPYPSRKDIDLAFYDDVAYVIISLMGGMPEVKAFRIKDGRAEEIPMEVSEDG